VNKVLLAGRLTRDPELRATSSGKHVTQFNLATNEYAGGKERTEFHTIVTWDRLAEICGRYLGKAQQVAVEGRIQTRTWDDDAGKRHWKTEIVASSVEMLSGRRKKDYAAESAADSLEHQAAGFAIAPTSGADEAEDDLEAPVPEAVAA
jgi:single-strand DNA-binding protein